MLHKLNSVAFYGIDAVPVQIEVNVASRGFPSFDIVGLPHKSIAESKQRIRAAIQNSGYKFPNKKITVNLAPADLPKQGTFYDLPIALGIIAYSLNLKLQNDTLFFGELSLDGSLRLPKGLFQLILFAQEKGLNKIIVSNLSSKVFLPKNLTKSTHTIIYGCNNLNEIVLHLQQKNKLSLATFAQKPPFISQNYSIFNQIVGQNLAKRALAISAAGGHNLLLCGPPGVGKTMLARSLCELMPTLSTQEFSDVAKIYSMYGHAIDSRPFRSPHHTISYSGMLGGGVQLRPGEITFAHRGVLFLDELPEFKKQILEALRQPMEDGFVQLSRQKGSVNFPSKFVLIAAMNPCPCGYSTHDKIICKCKSHEIDRYTKKISGPLLDRIDLYVDVGMPLETSTINVNEIKSQIVQAHKVQQERFKSNQIVFNSEMSNTQTDEYCKIDSQTKKILNQAKINLNLSLRGYYKILKVARTIADLDQKSNIMTEHVMEALQYRKTQAI